MTIEWKTFDNETPEMGKLILYGNHRFVETMVYNPDHPKMKESGKLAFKKITHWCYIDRPPVVEWESKWIDNE